MNFALANYKINCFSNYHLVRAGFARHPHCYHYACWLYDGRHFVCTHHSKLTVHWAYETAPVWSEVTGAIALANDDVCSCRRAQKEIHSLAHSLSFIHSIDRIWICHISMWWHSATPVQTHSYEYICSHTIMQSSATQFEAEIHISDTNVSVWNANYAVLHCFLNQMHWSTNRG